jgi:hypothetical protein
MFPEWERNHKNWLSSELENYTYKEPLASRKALLASPNGELQTVRFILPSEMMSLNIYKRWNAWKGFSGPALIKTPKKGNITNVVSEYIPGNEMHMVEEVLQSNKRKWTNQLYAQVYHLHSLHAYINDGLSCGVVIDQNADARIIDLGDLATFSAKNYLQKIAENYRSIDALFEE